LKICVTGGTGFIGSALVLQLVNKTEHFVVNIDSLTYAARPESLASVSTHERYHFEQGDIADQEFVQRVISTHRPDWIINLAAESHVDRSIDGPGGFVHTNILGTFILLEEARNYFANLTGEKRNRFRLLHVSTDEVFGSLGDKGLFTEDSPYDPSSPYSATKAGADHMVRSWFRTYGLPTLISNCTNNYGPRQFPEKLIPLVITNALLKKPLPVYGDGQQVRDWLFVQDHANALMAILEKGQPGRTYGISGRCERPNIDVVKGICSILDNRSPDKTGNSYNDLITYVEDRPGHDRRYAIDPTRINEELAWAAETPFEEGLEQTVEWYLENVDWWESIRQEKYDGARLGTITSPD